MSEKTRWVADDLGITIAEAEERVAAMVGAMTWSNLTRPIVDQMRASPHAWRSLVHIAITKFRSRGFAKGGEWGAGCPAGIVQLSINPKGGVRSAVRMRSAPTTIGPNELAGRRLDIANVQLPETLLLSMKGRRLDEILESTAFLAIVDGSTRLRRASAMSWGTRLTLDLPFIQPSANDLAAIRAANDPSEAH